MSETANPRLAKWTCHETAVHIADVVIDLEKVRLAAFACSIQRVGLAHADGSLAQELNEYYFVKRFEAVDLFPDALPVLATLRARYKVGLLSNGNSAPERVGLGDRFDWALFATGLGVAKPDPEIYRRAAGVAGLRPDELVMVGDSAANDVAAAKDAGWRGVWLNRDGDVVPAGVEPDAVVTTLAQVPDLVRSWS